MDESDEVDGNNLGVARVAYNLLEESTIGFVATAGDPRSDEDNYLVGFDFNLPRFRVSGRQDHHGESLVAADLLERCGW